MFHAGDALADFLALHAGNVAQHALVAEVFLGQVVGRQGGRVVGRQGNQVMEDAGFAGRVGLEGADFLVGRDRQFRLVVFHAHQLGAFVGGHVLAVGLHDVIHLLAEVQGPVDRGAVVVHELGVRDDLADFADHAADLRDMRFFRFNPQQVGAVLQRGDAIEHATLFAGTGAELEQVAWQAFWTQQLAFALEDDVAIAQRIGRHFFAVEEGVVLVAQVAWFIRDGDLLGQAGAQGVRAGDDDAVVHAQFQEGVADGTDLGQEVFMWHRDFTVLVAALFLVRYLVFDLDAAGARFDELFRQQVRGFRIAETGVDVGDDGHDVGDVAVDLGLDRLLLSTLGRVQLAEQAAQFAGIGLAQEGVQFADQAGDGGLFMHRLVWQRAELGAQGGNHPAGQVEVAAVGAVEVLLDRDHLLLTDETVPATERLGVLGWVRIVGSHVVAHDLRRVLGDVQARLEFVLGAHAGGGLGIDGVPGAALLVFQTGNSLDVVLILGHVNLLKKKRSKKIVECAAASC